MKKVCAFVPIKLRSVRLPNKMFLKLGDTYICEFIFHTLLEVKKIIDMDIYCYCSDPEIIQHLPDGVRFLQRSKHLDSDTTKGIDIYNAFCSEVTSDIYALFHATSPFIRSDSIIKGLQSVIDGDYDSAFSCSKIQTFCWYDNSPINYKLTDVIKTQDLQPVLWETSAFYIFHSDVINEQKRRIGNKPFMVHTDKIESVDIDEYEDFKLCKALYMLNMSNGY